MKAATLSKIAMQIAVYFSKAYDLSQTNQHLKAYDSGKFCNIMQYHSIYFSAMSYYVLAQEEFKVANEKSQGMGKVVSLWKRTAAEFDRAKPVIGLIPSNYQDNFNTRYAEVVAQRDKAIKENNTIYFDREIPLDQVPKPDCQNFVKLEPALDNITGKLAIEEKLRHIVPPQVRVMQTEIK
jgi:hypothetical protein